MAPAQGLSSARTSEAGRKTFPLGFLHRRLTQPAPLGHDFSPSGQIHAIFEPLHDLSAAWRDYLGGPCGAAVRGGRYQGRARSSPRREGRTTPSLPNHDPDAVRRFDEGELDIRAFRKRSVMLNSRAEPPKAIRIG